MFNHHLQPKKKRNWTRFIIYFIVIFIIYQFTKFIYHSFTGGNNSADNSITNQDQQYHHDHYHEGDFTTTTTRRRNKFYKPQTILEFESDNKTYHDFPWYQTQHTRPQFKPNANFTTTKLSIKEREIMLQKAILQAKKRVQKKFLPNDYTGIRGTRFTTADETAAFRNRVDCWTKGQWIKEDDDDNNNNSFQLKHVQDPIYSTCDNKFYKTHQQGEKRDAVKYRWVPTSPNCPLKNAIDSKNWCKVLKGRNMLLVGDLPHYQYHELLLDSFRDEPTVCFGELNCKDHTICKNKDTRLRYIRNDILSTIRKFQNRDGGHPLANIVEWPFVTSNILSSYPILILSRTALIGDDDVLFTRRLIHTMKVIRETSPDALVIYKSSFVGHPFCDDATRAMRSEEWTDEELKKLPFGWSETKRRNAIAKAVIEAAGGLYIDLASMVDLRPDGHVGGSDCLRYCIPGPLDATIQVLYHVFLGLEN